MIESQWTSCQVLEYVMCKKSWSAVPFSLLRFFN